MKNKKIIYGILLVSVVFVLVLSFGLYNHYKIQKQDEANLEISIAKEHLQKYVHNAFPDVDFFSMVKKTELIEGECEANHYWERWDQPPTESQTKHQCFIIKFYYYGPAEGSHLSVYVDKNTNEVIGGTQTR